MATLREYFDADFPTVLNIASTLTVTMGQGSSMASFQVPSRVHYRFESGAKYISYFVPSGPLSYALSLGLVTNPQWPLDAAKGMEARSRYPGERMVSTVDLKFSGRIFLYTEDLLSEEQNRALEQMAKEKGFDVVLRNPLSAQERSRFEKPLGFICHDWRDKQDIARPIALGLMKLSCPVWYDEYSLKVGDSLRVSVEKGLKESKKCVLVLSPHFLSNAGWTKTEFDSIFTRQILEGANVVLPVWCGVTKQQIYDYSPSLLDRLAVQWNEGIDEVLRKLYRAIEPPLSLYARV